MKNVSDLFDEMREEAATVSIVLDEYGDLAGMITMEGNAQELLHNDAVKKAYLGS